MAQTQEKYNQQIAKWKQEVLKHFQQQYFMSHPDNWQELAQKAADEYIQKNLPKNQPVSSNQEIQVTPSNDNVQPSSADVQSEVTPTITYSSEISKLDPEYQNYKKKQQQESYKLGSEVSHSMNEAGNTIGNIALTAADFTPLWAANMAGRTGLALYNDDYKGAAEELVAGVLAPYAIGKIGKGVIKGGKYAWQNRKLVGDAVKNTYEKGKGVVDLYKSGRLQGLIDEIKYDVYDKVQGYRIYKNMPDASNIYKYKPYHPSHNTAVDDIYTVGGKQRQGLPLTETEARIAADTPITSGISDFDNGAYQTLSTQWSGNPDADMAFMGSYGHTRVGGNTGRQWRMGFSTTPGKRLPKSFAEAQRQAIAHAPSGSFISADSHHLTIPEQIEFMRKIDPKISIREGIKSVDDWTFTTTPYGMSPDAYRFFTLQGQLPGNRLVYAGKTGLFNEYAVRNANVYNWQQAYKRGDMTAKQYVDNFNNWVKEFGGRPGHVDFKTGEPVFYHPVIYKNKQGGKLNYLKLYL